MDLSEMIKTGPDPARGIGALVLRRYKDIELARQQRWRWSEIAEGLGLPAARGPALAEAFNRTAKTIAEKKLKPIDAPVAGTARTSRQTPAATTSPTKTTETESESGFRNRSSVLPEGWGGQ